MLSFIDLLSGLAAALYAWALVASLRDARQTPNAQLAAQSIAGLGFATAAILGLALGHFAPLSLITGFAIGAATSAARRDAQQRPG